MLGSLVGTNLAIETLPFETLRGVVGFSLVFGLVRGFTESTLQVGGANSIRPSTPDNSAAQCARCLWHHTTIAIDVQYYEK
jgi:hypothetical protein